nr:MAG TPA: hypothetical protein [Caudoviricetes sp.]
MPASRGRQLREHCSAKQHKYRNGTYSCTD